MQNASVDIRTHKLRLNSPPGRIAAYLHDRYSVEVELSDSGAGRYVDMGSFSGKRILINAEARDELGLVFILAHLFGHMVQFSNYEKYRHLVEAVEKPKPLKLSLGFKKAFRGYEGEAAEIGKGLLEKVFGKNSGYVKSIDGRFQTYMDTDFRIYWHQYLMAGRQVTSREFNTAVRMDYQKQHGHSKKPLFARPLPLTVDPKKDVLVY
jgi:hypothetical protein